MWLYFIAVLIDKKSTTSKLKDEDEKCIYGMCTLMLCTTVTCVKVDIVLELIVSEKLSF